MRNQLSLVSKISSSTIFMAPKSEQLALQTQRDSLSEIFDILLWTARVNEKEEKRQTDKNREREEGNKIGNIIDNDLRLVAEILNGKEAPNGPPNLKSSSPHVSTKSVLLELINQNVSESNGQKSSIPIKADNNGQNDDLLVVAKVSPQLLHPKVLADTMALILSEVEAASISREEFISMVRFVQL